MLIKTIAGILALLVLLAVAAIARNNVPLLEPPGPGKRLLIYMTRNTAKTDPGHSLPELRTRTYDTAPDRLFQHLKTIADGKGWSVADSDPDAHKLHLVVSTPLLRFKDDLHVNLESDGQGTRLNVSSSSRVGRADYGANIGHIIELHSAIDSTL